MRGPEKLRLAQVSEEDAEVLRKIRAIVWLDLVTKQQQDKLGMLRLIDRLAGDD